MRSLKTLMAAVLAVGTVATAQAELQNVEIDGSLRIRGNWYDMDNDNEQAWVEHRTRLGVKADFTDEVSTYIEFDNYNIWGNDFRSNFITGADAVGEGGGDVALYQSYIEINNAWGLPIRTRIGRQEVELGSEWLLGNNDTASRFTGLSWDGFRTTYTSDSFTVDVLSLKMSETLNEFADGDANLYGIYGSYIGLEDWQFDAYWLFVMENEGDNLNLTLTEQFPLFGVAAEDTNIHTIGLRGAGTYGAFDLEAELAYQFGDVEIDTPGFLWFDNDDDFDYDAFAFNLEAGYTFDMTWTPRVYLGAAFFEGGDLGQNANWFGDNDNDLAFNRLFSNWEYSEFIENTELSNSLIYRAGISAMPTEKISLLLAATYFQADEETEGWQFLWWGDSSDDEEGLELGLYGDYQYSEDLVFRAGYAHFFGDDGLEDSNFVLLNGFGALTDDDSADYDYLFWEAEISF